MQNIGTAEAVRETRELFALTEFETSAERNKVAFGLTSQSIILFEAWDKRAIHSFIEWRADTADGGSLSILLDVNLMNRESLSYSYDLSSVRL